MKKYRLSSQIAIGIIMAAMLTSCIAFPDGPTTCTEDGPNSGSWPYCAPSEPGGPGPADEPIDPSGSY